MKIGICGNVLASLGDFNERYAIAGQLGLTALDLSLGEKWSVGQIYKGENFGFFDQSVEEITAYFLQHANAARANGIEVFQVHAPFPSARVGKDEMNAYTHMVMEKCIEVTAAIGCKYMVVHPIYAGEHTTYEEGFKLNYDYFADYAPLLEKHGVVMCIENAYHYYHGRIISVAGTGTTFLSKLVDELNKLTKNESYGICYDTGHANITGKNHFHEILQCGKRLKTLHIHDTDGVHDTHLIPYTGRYIDRPATDWEGILKALAKIDYEGSINFESDSGVLGMPEEARAAAINLNVAIGRYFDRKIKEYKQNNA